MAGTNTVSKNFDLGFISDASRDQLPTGAAWRMTNYIPRDGAPLRKRGGWGYGSQDLSGFSAANNVSGVGWAPFAGDPHLIAVSDGGKVYQVKTFPGGSFLATSHGQAMTHRPFWHVDRVILPAALGAAAANPYKVIAGYSVAAVGGTPPQARVGCSWGSYLLLANYYDPSDAGALKNYRLAWSGVGSPDSWTLSGASASTFDMDSEVLAVMRLRNLTFVWGYDQTWLLTGDTPPPGGNIAKNSYLAYGTFDGRSVTRYRDYAVWANNGGVYKSDGATFTDLTDKGGISLYYRSLVAGFSFTQGWKAAGGMLFGHYFLTITNSVGEIVTTLVCDVERQVWFELANMPANMYAERVSGPGTVSADGHEEMFFAHRSIPRVGMTAQLWTPVSPSDADGNVVLPSLETPFYKLGDASSKRIRRVYLSHDIRDPGGTNPYLTMSMVTSPEDTNYTALTPTFAATTAMKRRAAVVARRTNGVGFKIQQTNASSETRLYEIELEGHGLEQSY